MISKPNFSVVIPLYNKASHIKRAIDSVLQQSEQDFEIIVVNDGSSDGGEEFVRQYDEARIRLYEQENAGVSVARNKGVELSRGEHIAFLDADDEWMPHFLAEILNLIKSFPEAKMYSTAYTVKRENGSYINPAYEPLPKHPWKGIISNYIECKIHDSEPVTSSTVCIKKEVFESLGGFIPGMKIGEDTEMWFRISFKYQCVFSSQRCAIYYKDGINRSNVITSYSKDYYKFIEIIINKYDKDMIPSKFKIYLEQFISNRLLYLADFYLIHNEKKEALKILMDPRIKFNFKKKMRLLAIWSIPDLAVPMMKKASNLFKKERV